MEILKSLLCEANAVMIACYVLDVVLILGAIIFFIWYFAKNSKKNVAGQTKTPDEVEKINDDTYVISGENAATEEVEYEPVRQDNVVEHFSNQLTDIYEPHASELKSTAVIVNHEVEQPVKKIVKKDEISNYVMIDGVKKEKTEHDIEKSFNRGSNAFKNSTNFLNTIKEVAVEEKKEPAAPAKKTTKK